MIHDQHHDIDPLGLSDIETNLSDFERKMDEFLHRITIDFN